MLQSKNLSFIGLLIIACLALLPMSAQAREWAAWCESEPSLGWHFYCDDAVIEELPPPAEPQSLPQSSKTAPDVPALPDTTPTATATATERLEAMRAELLEARALAVLEPTTENVENYIRLQSTVLVQSGNFADTWRRVVWQNPDLDYEGQHPQSNLGKKAAIAELEEARQFTIKEVANNYALLYVGSARCAVCRVYGPHLRRFADKYGFTTMGVTVDGSAMEAWPEARQDNGQLTNMGVDANRIPLTILYHGRLRQVTVLGVGYLSETQLKKRIHALIKQEVGDAF